MVLPVTASVLVDARDAVAMTPRGYKGRRQLTGLDEDLHLDDVRDVLRLMKMYLEMILMTETVFVGCGS
jgi:hypothetical protein